MFLTFYYCCIPLLLTSASVWNFCATNQKWLFLNSFYCRFNDYSTVMLTADNGDKFFLNFNLLPQFFIRNVFLHVPVAQCFRVELVCKHWQTLLNDSWLHRRYINMSLVDDREVAKKWCFRLIEHYSVIFDRCAATVRSIDFSGWNAEDRHKEAVLSAFVMLDFAQLFRLNFTDVYLSPTCMQHLSNLHQLRSLNIKQSLFYLPVHSQQMSDSVRELLHSLHLLKEIGLDDRMNGETLEQLSRTVQILDVSFWMLTDLTHLFTSGPRQELTEFHFYHSSGILENEVLEILLSSAPNIVVLGLYSTTGFNVDCFETVAKFRLKKLFFTGNWACKDNAFGRYQKLFLVHMSLSQSPPTLEVLHLNDFVNCYAVSNDLMANFSNFCNNLKELNLNGSFYLAGCKILPLLYTILNSCPTLERLSLCDCRLEDSDLDTVATLCTNLCFLDISRSYCSAEGIERLADSVFSSQYRQRGKHFTVQVSASGITIQNFKVKRLIQKYKLLHIFT